MKYAVIKNGGKQYRVLEGEEILLDYCGEEEGKEIELKEILLFVNENDVQIGQPVLSNITIKAKVLSNFKGEKIRVSRFKAKSRSRTVKGFRPKLTKVKIGEMKESSVTKPSRKSS